MKTYQTLSILGFLYLGLFSTSTMAQKGQNAQKLNASASMSNAVQSEDIEKLNYQFCVDFKGKMYSGYSLLGLNPAYYNLGAIEQGKYKMDAMVFEKKINIADKKENEADVVLLSQWMKENIEHKGNVVVLIDGVVVNTKTDVVLLDKTYVLDYGVTLLDQVGLEQELTIVQLRMKSLANFKALSIEKKGKRTKI